MASKSVWGSLARAAAVLSLAALCACGSDDSSGGGSSGGAGASTPLLWVPQGTGTAGAGTLDTPLLWIDPNSGIGGGGGGVGGIITSQDDRTYDQPTQYIAGNVHPLMTSTSSTAITIPEDALAGSLNGYRQSILGVGGGGIIGGGIPIGGTTGVLLPMANSCRKNSRAWCKHFASFHTGIPMDNGANPEGDMSFSGTVAPGGTMAKSLISVGAPSYAVRFQGNYPDANAAYDYMIQNYGAEVTDPAVTHWGIGYWPGSSDRYWSVMIVRNPNPIN